MKKHLVFFALVVGCVLTANAQIVQTLNMNNGSVMHGYIKNQHPGKDCTFWAENATIVMDGNKAKKIFENKNVAYDALSDGWKKYADENGLLNEQQELRLSSIDTGNVINNVFVLEKGLILKYIEVNQEYLLKWDEISSVEYSPREEMVLTGVNHSIKMRDGSVLTGQCIKEMFKEKTMFFLGEDGVVESVAKNDIMKDNLIRINPKQPIIEQSKLLDSIKMKNGDVIKGIITEQNYETNPYFFIITMKSGNIETLRFKEVAEYHKIPNPDYVEVRDIRLDKGHILVNGVNAEQVMLCEQQNVFLIRPEMKRVDLKLTGASLEIVIEANFNNEKESSDNYFIKTNKFTKDPKRANLNYFTNKDIIYSNIKSSETETNTSNTTRIVYHVKSKGMYVFYISSAKKAVLIDVK